MPDPAAANLRPSRVSTVRTRLINRWTGPPTVMGDPASIPSREQGLMGARDVQGDLDAGVAGADDQHVTLRELDGFR